MKIWQVRVTDALDRENPVVNNTYRVTAETAEEAISKAHALEAEVVAEIGGETEAAIPFDVRFLFELEE